MYQKTVLSNGLPVLTVPMPHVRSVSVAIFLGAGSRYETEQQAGISHFIEHMLFKGTRNRPAAQQISECIERVGGYLNAATDREMTVYWAKVARPYFGTALELLADMLLNSLMEPKDLETERKVILEELGSINDSPAQKVDILIDEAVWPGQPLGRDVAGTRESVSTITRQMMLDYASAQYVSNNAVVGVAGDIGHDEVVEAVGKMLGAWQPGEPRSWIPSRVAEQNGPVARMESRKTQQAHFCLALRGLSSRHPDRYALDLLNAVLGEGMSSRLFLEIREKRGLAYEIHSSVSHYLDDGAVMVYAGVEPRRINDAIQRALAEVGRMREPVPEDELEKAKAMSKGRLLLRTEDTRSMVGWVAGQELLNKEVKTIDDILETVDAITVQDLQRVAGQVIGAASANGHSPLHLAVVGPFRSQARFQRLLRL